LGLDITYVPGLLQGESKEGRKGKGEAMKAETAKALGRYLKEVSIGYEQATDKALDQINVWEDIQTIAWTLKGIAKDIEAK